MLEAEWNPLGSSVPHTLRRCFRNSPGSCGRLSSFYVVWVLLGLNHPSTLTHSLNAHNSKIKEFPWPNPPESVSEYGFKGMLMWNSLKWNPLHSEALSQDVLCNYKWLGLCKCSRHQISQVSHLRVMPGSPCERHCHQDS